MLTDRERIERQQREPALLRLDRALGRLKSVLTYMNTGAHPDDEHNGLLAALRFGLGMRVVVACSTRGEGGQNATGPERGAALGVLRTREMEAAARVLDAGVVWLGHGPDDPVHDFGFSKNGSDTLARWGEERIVERMVRTYRAERPDVVCPTFLDVPGQHGHHRAMTRAAINAFGLAADPSAFPEHFREGLRPWQVQKLYLPAWSGAGSSYDDEEPPPAATTRIAAPQRDPATGATYAQIGEWSRAWHRSQGMGVWTDAGRSEWPLHLLFSALQAPGQEADIAEGLPRDLRALGTLPGMPEAASSALAAAQDAMERAIASFPDREAITAAAVGAASALEEARGACPAECIEQIGHRLARKARELDAVLFEAQGVVARAAARPARLAPGRTGRIEVLVDAGEREVEVELSASRSFGAGRSITDRGATDIEVTVAPGARPSSAFPPAFDPLSGNGEPAIRLTMEIAGRQVSRVIELEEPLVVLPEASLRLDPDAVVVNLAQALPEIAVGVAVDIEAGARAPELSFEAPPGWGVAAAGDGLRLRPPADLRPGRGALRFNLAGEPAYSVTRIRSQVGTDYLARPAELPILALDARLPEGARVGYVGGGNDTVATWLSRLGVEVTDLGPERLARGDLSGLTTIVVGIFAFGTRSDLRAVAERLRSWVEQGGHLVTLYHRPSDGWDPDVVPPRRLKIGLPSIRWRVTDPAAPVRVLEPDHPLLALPNRIGPADWEGWDKERGLYFASEWDPAYVPLLAMSDPGETPLEGSLLSAGIGRGRHTHTSLVLHHQLEKLVPGAFRLLANLIQPA